MRGKHEYKVASITKNGTCLKVLFWIVTILFIVAFSYLIVFYNGLTDEKKIQLEAFFRLIFICLIIEFIIFYTEQVTLYIYIK